MCDYSLESQISRSAQAGDRIKTSAFPNTRTRGFCDCGNGRIAVCVLPGTEISFDQPIGAHGIWSGLVNWFQGRSRLARFRQIETDNAHTHHDALELDNGRIVLLTRLNPGQLATVLQLPAVPPESGFAREMETTVVQDQSAPAIS